MENSDRVKFCTDQEKWNLFESTILDSKNITLELTVDTGFEYEAWSEIIEKFNHTTSDVLMSQGRVYTNIDVEKYNIVRQLRSIDNIYLVAAIKSNMLFTETGLDNELTKSFDIQKIQNYAKEIQLEKYIKLFAQLTKFNGNIFPTELEHARAKSIKQKSNELKHSEQSSENVETHDVLKYRVTCKRIGTHSFTSNEAATAFGGILNDVYQWVVDLSDYDVEIVYYIRQNESMVLFKLSKESLHKRLITEFGNTTLRPSIAYNMLRMAKIVEYDLVLDPLCGSGSIVLEAYPYATTMCGDIDPIAVNLTTSNIRNAAPGLPTLIECNSWDSTNLPLDTNSVHVICTDLPFGKRCGKRSNNSTLYPLLFKEFARVLKNEGRLVLLTYDRKNLKKAFQVIKDEVKLLRCIQANVGGLKTIVAVYKRNCRGAA